MNFRGLRLVAPPGSVGRKASGRKASEWEFRKPRADGEWTEGERVGAGGDATSAPPSQARESVGVVGHPHRVRATGAPPSQAHE
eukprot:6868846-Heterocapsa_arctica.AAC.1